MNTASRKQTIFLDSNIVFSALTPDTQTRFSVAALYNNGHRLTVSPYVIGEVNSNLPGAAVREQLAEIAPSFAIVPDAPLFHRVPLSETDKPILAAALASGADFLLTGNIRDFKHLYGTSIEGMAIVSPVQIAELLLKPSASQ